MFLDMRMQTQTIDKALELVRAAGLKADATTQGHVLVEVSDGHIRCRSLSEVKAAIITALQGA